MGNCPIIFTTWLVACIFCVRQKRANGSSLMIELEWNCKGGSQYSSTDGWLLAPILAALHTHAPQWHSHSKSPEYHQCNSGQLMKQTKTMQLMMTPQLQILRSVPGGIWLPPLKVSTLATPDKSGHNRTKVNHSKQLFSHDRAHPRPQTC